MVDEAVTAAALRHVDQYLGDLEAMRGLSKDEHLDDMVTQRAVERTLMNLIRAWIDVASHVRATEDLSPSGTSKREVEALGEAGVISSDTQAKMEEAVWFRNVLAHRYGEVDHGIDYDVPHEDLEWFERDKREVATWVRDRRT